MTRESLSRAARLLAAATALAVGVAGASPAQAAPGDKSNKKQKPRQVHPTGEEDAKAPTAVELQGEAALEQMTSRSTEGLAVVQHENGMTSMDLDGRFMSVMVAVTRKDGTKAGTCVDSHDKLAKARKARPEAVPAVAASAPKAASPAPVLEEK